MGDVEGLDHLAEFGDLGVDARGEGVAGGVAEDRLEVRIERTLGDLPEDAAHDGADPRRVTLRPVGARWAGTVWPVAL